MQLFSRILGEGKPLLILHGVFGSSDNLFTVSKAISEQGFEVHTLDARNHGQSPHADAFSYEIMAEDLYEYIEEKKLKNPIIMGHSMGGKVVMQFAMKHDNFEKLIIVDIAPKFYPTHHGHIIKGLNAIPLENIQNRKEAEDIFKNYVSDVGERQFLLKNLYRTDDGKFAWRINLPVLTREIYQIGGELSDIKTVEKPVLFLRGSESSYIMDEDISFIKRVFPKAEVLTIEGANHWVHATKPTEFVAAVVDFAGE